MKTCLQGGRLAPAYLEFHLTQLQITLQMSWTWLLQTLAWYP